MTEPLSFVSTCQGGLDWFGLKIQIDYLVGWLLLKGFDERCWVFITFFAISKFLISFILAVPVSMIIYYLRNCIG